MHYTSLNTSQFAELSVMPLRVGKGNNSFYYFLLGKVIADHELVHLKTSFIIYFYAFAELCIAATGLIYKQI